MKPIDANAGKGSVIFGGIEFVSVIVFACVLLQAISTLVVGRSYELTGNEPNLVLLFIVIPMPLWAVVYGVLSKSLIHSIGWETPPSKLRGISAVVAVLYGSTLVAFTVFFPERNYPVSEIRNLALLVKVISSVFGFVFGFWQIARLKGSSLRSVKWGVVTAITWLILSVLAMGVFESTLCLREGTCILQQ